METLIQEINSAFIGMEHPSDNQLLHLDCMDDVDILEFYGGVRWEEMSNEMIIYSYAAPTSFSPMAFRYYLPAYLIWTLKNANSIGYAGESILLALDPGTDKEMLHKFRKSKFTLFNLGQVAVIKKFLWHLSDHNYLGEFADRALMHYWMET